MVFSIYTYILITSSTNYIFAHAPGISQQSDASNSSLTVQGWYALFPNHSANVELYLIGYSALLGGTLFEIGGFCAFLESINRPVKGAVNFDYEVWLLPLCSAAACCCIAKTVP